MKKIFAVGVILLFVGVTIAPAIALDTEKSQSTSRGNWLYVGGDGPGNYTKIQDAINVSSDGDTVFVFNDSSPYNESIVIDKSIRVIGEDKNTTIILGIGMVAYEHSSIVVSADNVFFSGFTVQQLSGWHGIWIIGNESNITDTIIDDYWYGIYIWPGLTHKDSTKNTIYHNLIKNCFTGVHVYRSSNNLIDFNIINNCEMDNRWGSGIHLCKADNTIISHNDIRLNGVGIYAERSNNVSISLNNIKENAIGISTSSMNNMKITQNNIFRNRQRNIVFSDYILQNMYVDNNYWGIPRFFPKIIFGQLLIYLFTLHLDKWNPYVWIDWPFYLHLPKIYIDKNPAKEPYDIPGVK